MNYESSLSETDTENEYTGDNKILELNNYISLIYTVLIRFIKQNKIIK